MAVTNVSIHKRTGKQTLTGGKRVRVYQIIFHVKCNTINEDPVTIIHHAEIPTLAPISVWPSDYGAVLVDIDPQQDEERPDFWVVTCSYTSNPDIKTEDPPDENPLLRPAIVTRSPQQRQRVLERDTNGDLYLNTAGDLFIPPEEREEHPPSYTVTKNMIVWPYALEIAYADAINSDVIAIVSKGISAAIGTMKFNGFSGSEQFENDMAFWSVSASFEVNWEGWNAPILSCGYQEKKYDAIEDEYYLWPIVARNAESTPGPIPLNSAGAADPYGTPFYMPFKKYREVPFATLFALFGL